MRIFLGLSFHDAGHLYTILATSELSFTSFYPVLHLFLLNQLTR